MMKPIHVLFVDDEEDIRYTFKARFEDHFSIYTASNGVEALDVLKTHPSINVVVTDIRMPGLDGLAMIRKAREYDQDIGFIVVSGHADTAEIIEALKVGARSFLRKPYEFTELEETIHVEARRYQIIREEREEREREKAVDQFLHSINQINYVLPNQLKWVNHLSFRLVNHAVSLGVCNEDNRVNMALGLIEILTNAIEHGNLAITGKEKIALKTRGESHYMDEINYRSSTSPFKERSVRVSATMDSEKVVITVEDEGVGFDVDKILDPTEPENLFASSGRGILLARTFLDEVKYNRQGNKVTLVKYRQKPS